MESVLRILGGVHLLRRADDGTTYSWLLSDNVRVFIDDVGAT